MNIKDFKASLPYLFEAQVTPFVWGHSGIGKSTILRQVSEELGYKFFPFYLGTMSDVGDILGLATFTKDAQGNDVGTHFAPPTWLKDMIDYCNENPQSGAVVFLDEFNRGRRDILNGMFSLALDKTFHTIKLPKNCHVVAAGNPPTEEYYTTDVNETALMARFAHIKLEPSFNEWLSYAQAANFEPSLVSFLREQPDLLEDHKTDFKLPVKVDRRSYERLDRLFKIGTPSELLEQLMMGIIGIERVVSYKHHITKTDKPLTGEQVFEGKNKEIVIKWSYPKDIKSSMLSITCDNVFDTLQLFEKNKTVPTEAQLDNFLEFLQTLPKETFYTLSIKLMKAQNKIYIPGMSANPRYRYALEVLARDAKGMKQKK